MLLTTDDMMCSDMMVAQKTFCPRKKLGWVPKTSECTICDAVPYLDVLSHYFRVIFGTVASEKNCGRSPKIRLAL